MSYVKRTGKSKLWVALAVLALVLIMGGYSVNVMAEENQTMVKDLGEGVAFHFTVEDQTYTGTALCPAVKVTEELSEDVSGNSESTTAKTLQLNKDYIVSYSNNINAGKATVTVTGKGEYTGKKEIDFTIKPVDISFLELTMIDCTYSGAEQKPNVKLYFNGKRLTRGTDYHVGSYKNNINVGTAGCVVKGDGNYTGRLEKTFEIKAKNIYSLSYSEVTTKTYTGKGITPSMKIVDKAMSPDKTLTKNEDYIISYIDNLRVGTAGVIIEGIGNYSGSRIITFTIRPKSTTLVKVSRGKRKMKVYWNKQTAQVTGYEIQYATNSKFSKAKKVAVKNPATNKIITKLQGNKKYYVRIRTYKSVAGIKYYSSWSKAKTVITKK